MNIKLNCSLYTVMYIAYLSFQQRDYIAWILILFFGQQDYISVLFECARPVEAWLH
jgi:hypothetical protein